MPAYMVLNYDVTDPEALAAYRDRATPVLFGPGSVEVVAVSEATVGLPEGVATGTHTVILRFDDVAHAQAVYDADDYQAVLGERLAATRPNAAFIVAGV